MRVIVLELVLFFVVEATQIELFNTKDCSQQPTIATFSSGWLDLCSQSYQSMIVPFQQPLALYQNCRNTEAFSNPGLTRLYNTTTSFCAPISNTVSIQQITSIDDVCVAYRENIQDRCNTCSSTCATALESANMFVLSGLCQGPLLQDSLVNAATHCAIKLSTAKDLQEKDGDYKPTKGDKVVGYCLFGVGGVLGLVSVTGLIKAFYDESKTPEQEQEFLKMKWETSQPAEVISFTTHKL